MSTRLSSGEVVVGVDTTVSGRTALEWAAAYARATRAPLRAVHVFGPDAVAPTIWAPEALPGIGYPAIAGTGDSTRSEIQLVFDSLPPSLGWRLEFYEGPIGHTLVERSESADLLVIGTREHTGVDRLLNGSVSHYCVKHAACPIIAVPPKPGMADSGRSELAESVSHR